MRESEVIIVKEQLSGQPVASIYLKPLAAPLNVTRLTSEMPFSTRVYQLDENAVYFPVPEKVSLLVEKPTKTVPELSVFYWPLRNAIVITAVSRKMRTPVSMLGEITPEDFSKLKSLRRGTLVVLEPSG